MSIKRLDLIISSVTLRAGARIAPATLAGEANVRRMDPHPFERPRMTKLKVTGGILVGFGATLAGVATLAIFRVFPLSVEFFGFNLNTQGERLAWIASWTGVAVIGLLFLYLGRTGRRGESG